MTKQDREILARATGIIEGVYHTASEGQKDALERVFAMIDGVLDREANAEDSAKEIYKCENCQNIGSEKCELCITKKGYQPSHWKRRENDNT